MFSVKSICIRRLFEVAERIRAVIYGRCGVENAASRSPLAILKREILLFSTVVSFGKRSGEAWTATVLTYC